jgi:aryl-alcohol dehydrogenase-like predicted oxidoreductase
VLARYALDLVQLPLNVFSQSPHLGGRLKALKAAGCEIHVRSVFLQGLLLMDPGTVPEHLANAREPLRRFRAFLAARGLTPLQGALGFAAGIPEVDALICGVNNRRHLEELLEAYRPLDLDFSDFDLADQAIINPANWKAKT